MAWMNSLPEKLRTSLEKILEKSNEHEEAYMQAENASVGQMWVAMGILNQKVEKLEKIANAQRKALNNMEEDVNVNKHLDENLEESLKRY
jgi:hypothetical protein